MNLKIYSPNDFPKYLPKLSHLYDDLFSGGKGFRAKLIAIIGEKISLDEKAQNLLGQTIEFIHNASLLHDDLVDRSPLRRGKPSAWLKYNPEYAVLAGDYLLARVMVNLSHYGNIKLVQYTAEMISELLEGEWLQDSLVHDFSVDLSELDRVHNLKTSSLFRWCLKAPFIAQERYESELLGPLDEMGSLLGQLFQRSDDLLDFDIRNDEGKAVLGDLKSGYLNSFAAFCLQKSPGVSKEGLKKITTLGEFKNFFGGEQTFVALVEQFDEKNNFLIQLYQHHLNTLKLRLKPSEVSLCDKLEPLTDLLYWRKKPHV